MAIWPILCCVKLVNEINFRGILYLYLQFFTWITFLVNPFYMFGKTFGHSVNFRYRSITFFRFFFNFQVSKINLGKISQKERMDLPAISLREIGFQKNDDVALSFVFQPVVSRTIVAKIFMRRKYIKIIINECCT